MNIQEFKSFLRDMLSAASGHVSSKRVVGVLIWIILLWAYVYATITQNKLPEESEIFLVLATSLLGVDSVASIFKK